MNEYNTKRDGVQVIILETGEEFNSITACAKRLGVDDRWLGKILRGQGCYTCHGYHLQKVTNFNNDVLTFANPKGRPGKKVTILETGEEFNSITECAKKIKGSPSGISETMSNKRRQYKGYTYK